MKLESAFVAPSRLGDALDFCLQVARVGRSSAEFSVEVRCGDEIRSRIGLVIVCIALASGRPVDWPEEVRPRALMQAA